MQRSFIGAIVLCLVSKVHCSGPVGSITALATQSRLYSSQVRLSYFEPVNCTLSFDVDVASFDPQLLTKAETTIISNFVAVSQREFKFQVHSTTNDNVTLSIADGQVQNLGGTPNNATAFFFFQFYAFAPSVQLQLDGFPGHTTNKDYNIAYFLFNSTTDTDDPQFWFNESFVSFSPAIALTEFVKVSDVMYRFRFAIPSNQSYPGVTCVDSDALPLTSMHTIFACSLCERPDLLCESLSLHPPLGVTNMEFPFSLDVKSIPGLGLSNFSFTVVYDTLWGYVAAMDAPNYARDPFFLTITWSEPLVDLVAVKPTLSGPPVDQDLLLNNLTILSDVSFRLLIAPKATGILKISFNGSMDSIDLAGNSNDFYRNPNSRTGAIRYVMFSAGPPLPGSIAFDYQRPRFDQEYPPVVQSFGFQTETTASLTVSWSGFTTAVEYDTWIAWGENQSTPEVKGLNATQYIFQDFSALMGAEYQVYIRAMNAFGESLTTSRMFLHPKFYLNADASNKEVVALPDMLSPSQTQVSTNILVGSNTFLSMNPYKVITFRSVNRSAGDQDACRLNSPTTMCTYINFHMEVPASQFVVFRKPITLQFLFGRNGWPDLYFRPRLRYWDAHDDLWLDVAETCPTDQVFDRWNELHRIYEISVCHLSQFAVFRDFEPEPPTTVAPPPGRPDSFGGVVFWIILGGCAILGVLICCLVYFVFARREDRRTGSYRDMGIKPVSERLPSRRPLGNRADALALQDDPEQEQGLLALPAPNSESMLALVPAQELPALENEPRVSEQYAFTPSHQGTEAEPAKSYEILMPASGWAKSRSLLRDLWTMKVMPGGLLLKAMEGVDLTRLDYVEMAQLLFSIKLPGAVAGDEAADFSVRELSLLGDISVAVPVRIFDDGAFQDPVIHAESFEGTLIYTCGTLLIPEEASADWKELVTEEGTIDRQAYYKLCERRLWPCFQFANDLAMQSDRQAFITMPALGCDQFAGRFQGTLGDMLGDVLQQILETHAGKWPHIHVVYYDSLDEGRARREIIKGTDINFIVEGKGQIRKPQLCRPRDYEGALGGLGDDFSNCDLVSFVAWDRVSWPGNHYWGGNRETDDGIKTAASDAMYKFSGVEGKYDEARKQYMPPEQYKTWSEVLQKNDIKLDVSSLKDARYDANGPCDESHVTTHEMDQQIEVSASIDRVNFHSLIPGAVDENITTTLITEPEQPEAQAERENAALIDLSTIDLSAHQHQPTQGVEMAGNSEAQKPEVTSHSLVPNTSGIDDIDISSLSQLGATPGATEQSGENMIQAPPNYQPTHSSDTSGIDDIDISSLSQLGLRQSVATEQSGEKMIQASANHLPTHCSDTKGIDDIDISSRSQLGAKVDTTEQSGETMEEPRPKSKSRPNSATVVATYELPFQVNASLDSAPPNQDMMQDLSLQRGVSPLSLVPNFPTEGTTEPSGPTPSQVNENLPPPLQAAQVWNTGTENGQVEPVISLEPEQAQETAVPEAQAEPGISSLSQLGSFARTEQVGEQTSQERMESPFQVNLSRD